MRTNSFDAVVAQVRHFKDGPRPAFSLFLGAGASKSSGVPLAEELADLAFEERFMAAGNAIDSRESRSATLDRIRLWTQQQPWYNDTDKSRYQLAMENVLLAPGVRETFLKKNIGKARPRRGYRRLAQLLEARVFDTIYTTNFDDLVSRSCEGVLQSRLMNVAGDEAFRALEPSPCEPRLIRLHGDFWHGNVLNTEGDLESTPGLRFETVHNLSRPQGMIVIGYGGLDRKLMIELFHRNINDKTFLKNGLFWCIMEGSQVPAHVKVLLDMDGSSGRVHVIEIAGFDEAMEMLARGFGLSTDSWVLTESLRSSCEVQALLTDAAQLLNDLNSEQRQIRDQVNDVFSRLVKQLHAREAALFVLTDETSQIVSSVNIFSSGVKPIPSNWLGSSINNPSFEVNAKDMFEDEGISLSPHHRRALAYPTWRDGKLKGLAVFGFDSLAQDGEHDERVISSVCGLLTLAAERYLTQELQNRAGEVHLVSSAQISTQLEQIRELAYSYWERRGRCDGSQEEDWLRAEEEITRVTYGPKKR